MHDTCQARLHLFCLDIDALDIKRKGVFACSLRQNFTLGFGYRLFRTYLRSRFHNARGRHLAHRLRCSPTLRSSTGDGSVIGRSCAIVSSDPTRLRYPQRCIHAAAMIGERLTPPTQWISRFPCRMPCAIAAITASNYRAEIGRESAIGTRV